MFNILVHEVISFKFLHEANLFVESKQKKPIILNQIVNFLVAIVAFWAQKIIQEKSKKFKNTFKLYQVFIFLKLAFTPYNAQQPQRSMQLQEKEA